jgi:hypothetical protein
MTAKDALPFDSRGRAGEYESRPEFIFKSAKGVSMAKLALIYGMRLFPSEELGEVGEATVQLKNGRTARVSMHLIEGSKEEIEETLRQSVAAFFEMYPEI